MHVATTRPAPAVPTRDFAPRLSFPSAPEGATKQIEARMKLPFLPDQSMTGVATITKNDGYTFAGTIEGRTRSGGTFTAAAQMAQIGADLVQYDWKGVIHPFGLKASLPFELKDTYRILDSRPDYLLLQPTARPFDTPTLFSYVDGEEVSSVGRRFGIRVDTVNR